MKRFTGTVLTIATLLAGCATHVIVSPTHREDLASQTRVLAIATANLENAVRGKSVTGAGEEAAKAVAALNSAAQHFARTASRWTSDEHVNQGYEDLIRAWVKVKQTFPDLNADALTTQSYNRVAAEWERTARVSGYANRKFQQELEQQK